MVEILIAILYVILISAVIWNLAIFRIENIKKSLVLSLFYVKILSGVLLTVIYTQYYGEGELSGDTAHYYEDGQVLNGVFFESSSDYFTLLFSSGDQELIESRLSESGHWTRSNMDQFNDNRFIIRINSIIAFISFNSYFVHVAIFVMLSLLGLILFFKSIQEFIPKYQKEILLIIVLFPSMLFWTSSILKESLLVFGFGMLIYGIRFFSQNPPKKVAFILVGVFVLLNTKIYFLICLFPALAIYLLTSQNLTRNVIILMGAGSISIVALYLNSYSKSFNITSFISQKQTDFALVGKGGVYFMDDQNFYRLPYEESDKIKHLKSSIRVQESIEVEVKPFGSSSYLKDSVLNKGSIYKFYEEQVPSNSLFEVPLVDGKWQNILFFSPVYISNVLLMPYPWQKASALKWLNILENILLLVLLILSIKYRRVGKDIDQKLLFCSIAFILLFYLIIGATTPIVGALVRYKTPAFLIWILLFLSIIDLERITLKSNKRS